MSVQPFSPNFGTNATVSLSASNSSSSASLNSNNQVIRIFNTGSSIAFVRWGIGAQTATTSDMAIGPGVVENFSKGNTDTIAAITASGTTTLSITNGEGM